MADPLDGGDNIDKKKEVEDRNARSGSENGGGLRGERIRVRLGDKKETKAVHRRTVRWIRRTELKIQAEIFKVFHLPASCLITLYLSSTLSKHTKNIITLHIVCFPPKFLKSVFMLLQ